VKWITENGLPDMVSFDHDLADVYYDPKTRVQGFKYHETTGYDAAKWMCEYCWTNGLPLPEWEVHSANPVGRDNINQLLENYKSRLNY